MISFLIAAACVWAYAIVGGFFGTRFYRNGKQKCLDCSGRYKCYKDHGFGAVLMGIAWPVALPAMLGMLIGENDRSERLRRQREKELEQAQHDAAVARQRRVEAEELSRQLRAVGKEELA